jgi:hypothetical protein
MTGAAKSTLNRRGIAAKTGNIGRVRPQSTQKRRTGSVRRSTRRSGMAAV